MDHDFTCSAGVHSVRRPKRTSGRLVRVSTTDDKTCFKCFTGIELVDEPYIVEYRATA